MMDLFNQIKFFLLITSIAVSTETSAQFFISGQEPASVKWKQINTGHFQLIFPEDFSEKAHYVANILEYAYDRVGYSLDHKPEKISVIIHNRSVRSNGFVAPAPHRIELYPVPPQDNLSMAWLEYLCIHEIRHVVQIDKLNQGITKILTWFFGEQANAAVAGMLPMWYLEGDAVIAETALTHDGRGRAPHFTRQVRSRLYDTLPLYSFDKMLLGSYRNNTPNHYELGYHMAAYARSLYGKELWQEVENFVARHPYKIFPFNLGLKRFTDLYVGALYDSTMSFYNQYYAQHDGHAAGARHQEIFTPTHDDYTSYRYPRYTIDGDILALKKDFSRLPRFVKISPESQTEHVVHIPGKMSFEGFSYARDLIAWSQVIPDLRWGNRSYSVIEVYDMQEGRKKQLTTKTRLFAPAISEKGDKIAAIRVTRANAFYLAILDSRDGAVMKEFTHPAGIFVQQPVWSLDGKDVFVIGLTDKGKTLYRVNIHNGKWDQLLQPTFREIRNLSAGRGRLYFTAALKHKEEICALNLTDNKVYRLSHTRINASDVTCSPRSNSILYVDYEPEGYNIYERKPDTDHFEPISISGSHSDSMVESMKEGENQFFYSRDVPRKNYDISSYSRLKNLFHFHSWAPLYLDYEMNQTTISNVTPGITLFSQNLLSTALTTLGYSYRSGTHALHTKMIYRGWYPVFSISAHYGGLPELHRPYYVDWLPELREDNLTFDFLVSLPLNFSDDQYISGVTPSVNYTFDRDLYYHYRRNYYLRGQKVLNYNLWFYAYQRMAYRDLMPRWGYTFDLNFRYSPFGKGIFGNMISGAAGLYMPGLIEDHGIKFSLGYQKQNPEIALFSNFVSFPRGYTPIVSQELLGLTMDYRFPLLYPDWNIPGLLYVKRIKAGIFQDYASNQYYSEVSSQRSGLTEGNFYSMGTEITSDFHLARFMFPITAGVRYAYLPEFSDHRFELIFGVDFYRIYSNVF
jgi:Tol biopolymer transport system component